MWKLIGITFLVGFCLILALLKYQDIKKLDILRFITIEFYSDRKSDSDKNIDSLNKLRDMSLTILCKGVDISSGIAVSGKSEIQLVVRNHMPEDIKNPKISVKIYSKADVSGSDGIWEVFIAKDDPSVNLHFDTNDTRAKGPKEFFGYSKVYLPPFSLDFAKTFNSNYLPAIVTIRAENWAPYVKKFQFNLDH